MHETFDLNIPEGAWRDSKLTVDSSTDKYANDIEDTLF